MRSEGTRNSCSFPGAASLVPHEGHRMTILRHLLLLTGTVRFFLFFAFCTFSGLFYFIRSNRCTEWEGTEGRTSPNFYSRGAPENGEEET
jgi:hypothetical protein